MTKIQITDDQNNEMMINLFSYHQKFIPPPYIPADNIVVILENVKLDRFKGQLYLLAQLPKALIYLYDQNENRYVFPALVNPSFKVQDILESLNINPNSTNRSHAIGYSNYASNTNYKYTQHVQTELPKEHPYEQITIANNPSTVNPVKDLDTRRICSSVVLQDMKITKILNMVFCKTPMEKFRVLCRAIRIYPSEIKEFTSPYCDGCLKFIPRELDTCEECEAEGIFTKITYKYNFSMWIEDSSHANLAIKVAGQEAVVFFDGLKATNLYNDIDKIGRAHV